ncbi:hypothetical protein EIP86_006841 [Pleurotus ostreatoroseus]|nr:hypothetical protein EIP86_006841 [Pleurotus ostreatoroseus]
MSATEVITLETIQHHTSSTTSINIRAQARSPHPPESDTPSRTSVEKDGDVELANISRIGESSRGGSAPPSQHSDAAEIKVPWWKPHLQYAACCSSLFLAGWNDGSTGPLLPTIQRHYHVGYAVVSLIFIFNCVGFVTAALANVHLTDRFGFGTVDMSALLTPYAFADRMLITGAIAQTIGYALEAPAPPFPVFVLGFAINGFGLALQDAGANGFVASLKDHPSVKMGILHAVYAQ